MFRRKADAYWLQFSVYQTFDSQEKLFEAVSYIVREYDLGDSAESVLNTLKLHSQMFFGVCWLKVSEIAKKSSLSVRTVHRALNLLRDAGIISIIRQLNTKRGGKAPNVYVINAVENHETGTVETVDNFNDASSDLSQGTSDGISLRSREPLSRPAEQALESVHNSSLSNSDMNFNRNLNNGKTVITLPDDFGNQVYADLLKDIPQEFVDIFTPYYRSSPEIIVQRWRTAQKACKYGATSMEYVCYETIREAWLITVKAYKLGKVRDTSDHGLGGYFYRVLCELSLRDYMDYVREHVWGA